MDGVNRNGRGGSSFNQREPLDAFSTERFLNHATTLHDSHFLEVRTKFTFRCFHRKASTLSKFRSFTTILTTGHQKLKSFPESVQ